MKYIKLKSIVLSSILILMLLSKGVFAQKEEVQMKMRAQWILSIMAGTTWDKSKEVQSPYYSVGVFSSKKEYNILKSLSAKKNVKGKAIKVFRYTDVEDLKPLHVIYVTKSEINFLPLIYSKFKGKSVLIISDRAKENAKYSVINFLPLTKSDKKFEIKTPIMKRQKVDFIVHIKKIGGDRDMLQEIYSSTSRKLVEEQNALRAQKKEMKEQQRLLDMQNERIKKQASDIVAKEGLITIKEQEILDQNQKLRGMQAEVIRKRMELEQNLSLLQAQGDSIEAQTQRMLKQQAEMDKASEILEQKQAEIKEIDERLGQSEMRGKFLQNIVYVFIVGGVLVFILLIGIVRSFIRNRKANRQLNRQYEAISSQKTEIENQSKELESANSELEKLSLVASETDNAVTLVDTEGNLEWVNAGFTRMYGYTLQLFRNEVGSNMLESSKNKDIKQVFEQIFKDKQTVSYQVKNKTRKGDDVWVQTTLTPILNDENEVVKFIAIDTDITEEKEFELELVKQKEHIEVQNEQIASSINYAKNIQQAILPLSKDMERFFESFVLFRPRDVVSGDFYWFVHRPAFDDNEEKLFMASVDCTGHGVPGAFMSMIGSRLLSEIVLEQKLDSPKDILEELDIKVKRALRQESTDNNDGMDVSLCMVAKEKKGYRLTYSGAKLDLYYCPHKENEIKILSSERRSIGGTTKKRTKIKFTDKEIHLQAGDTFWMITDGIIDQNNADRRRFGTPRLLESLDSVKDMPMSEQREIVAGVLDDYQGEEEQRDDITLLGFRFCNKW